MESPKLIVGLGNPGEKYANTRHNLGFEVVKSFAKRERWAFKRETRLEGKIAKGQEKGNQIYLLLPTTFMNLSGIAVRKTLNYFKIRIDHLLVIVDDVYTKLGQLRFREKGSSGGHNGLKSIEHELGTQEYCRLRVGVGPENSHDLPDGKTSFLEDFVLASFTPKETALLPEIIERGVQVIKAWTEKAINEEV